MSRGLAYLGLGSNLGDRLATLDRALGLLHGADVRVTASSSVYETEPVGPVQDQPPFLNMAARLETALEPLALLERCQAVERALGRPEARPLDKGPRFIDLDLLLLGELTVRLPGLEIPHPELANRAFVLAPLLELDPGLLDPRDRAPLAPRLADLSGQEIRKVQGPRSLPSPDLDSM